MIAVDQTHVEHETNHLISYIAPIVRSNEARQRIVTFIRDILHKSALLDGYIIECGSSSFKSYLPESDLDLVLLAPNTRSSREEIQCLTTVFNSWCDEIADKDEGRSSHPDMTIRNVEFVNARTKLAHCLVNNISVDITVNQIGAIFTLTFLEEADRLIGCDHLFKRSLLLIKTWCLHESARYCGSAITGAKTGMLSSYAVSVMVLHLFNKYVNLAHPFSVLRSFLYTFMNFPWESSVLTIDGAVPVSSYTSSAYGGYNHGHGHSNAHQSSDLLSVSTHNSNTSTHSGRGRTNYVSPTSADCSNRFQSILDSLAQHPALLLYQQCGNAVHHGRFTAKCCNIQDPVDPYNNLGISVPRSSLQLISQACRSGYHHLEVYLRRFPHCVPNPALFNGVTAVPVTISSEPEYMSGAMQGSPQQPQQSVTAQYDPTTGGYKYSASKGKQLLSPVAPANLGYVGTGVTSDTAAETLNHTNMTNNTNHTTEGPIGVEGVYTGGQQANTVSSHHHIAMPAVNSAPYRRNSRTSSIASNGAPNYTAQAQGPPPSFLTEFFPASLQLYSTPEGEALRCDLLTHPLQPLSSSILLANPHYHGNNNTGNNVSSAASVGSNGGGSVHSHRWEPLSPPHPRSAKAVNPSQSLPSHMDGTASPSSPPSAEPPPPPPPVPQDPLLGDLEAMYDALNLFVSSRGPTRRHEAGGKSPLSAIGGGYQSTSRVSLVSSSPGGMISPSALCAAEITALTASAKKRQQSTNHTPTQDAVHSGTIRAGEGLFSESTYQDQHGGAGSVKKTTSDERSPDGSTTSGTDSFPIRTGVSISDDSVSEGEDSDTSGTESDESNGSDDGSSDDDDRSKSSLSSAASHRHQSRRATGAKTRHNSVGGRGHRGRGYKGGQDVRHKYHILNLATVAIPYSPGKSLTSADAGASARAGYGGPIGSIVAFFLGDHWSAFCRSCLDNMGWKAPSPATVAASDQNELVKPTSVGTIGRDKATPSPSPAVSVGRRKGVTNSGQRADPKQKAPASTTSSASAKGTAMAAAAATRRSKRTVLQRLYHQVQLWCAGWFSRGIIGYFRPRPLFIALLYSLVMLLAFNVLLKSGLDAESLRNLSITATSKVAQLLKSDLWSGINLNGLLHSAGWQQPRQAPAPSAMDTTDDTPASAFDFSALFAATVSDDGATSPGASFLTTQAQSLGRAFAGGFSTPPSAPAALVPPTHWVMLGDSITFGDFGTYNPPETVATDLAPTRSSGAASLAAASAPTSSSSTRTTASTSSAVPKTRSSAPPSETVQRTQYVPKSEYVLAANSALKSPYTYQWTKDGANITNSLYGNQPFFSIKRIRKEDAGLYRCYRYEAAVARAPPVLVLETAVQISRPPIVHLKPSHREVKTGTTMVLNLAAEGTPPPAFQWYKNGYPVPGLTAQVLLMESVNVTHSGTYSCEVQNIAGRLMWLEATIVVTD